MLGITPIYQLKEVNSNQIKPLPFAAASSHQAPTRMSTPHIRILRKIIVKFSIKMFAHLIGTLLRTKSDYGAVLGPGSVELVALGLGDVLTDQGVAGEQLVVMTWGQLDPGANLQSQEHSARAPLTFTVIGDLS